MTVFRRLTVTFILAAILLATLCSNAFGQVDEAKEAINSGEFTRAVNILSEALASGPSADVYLYLGIAYGNMKEYQKAEDSLKEGANRFPDDARFHNELAGVYLARREYDAAKAELRRALEIDPHNSYASDLLASIDISEGEVQSALRYWNKSGRPVIDDILHNYYLNFGSWVVRDAISFHPSDVLHYGQWKTTEARLFQTNNFTNVGLEVEPTVIPDHYDAIVRTTAKTNLRSDIVWNLFKGGIYSTSYFDLWNIKNSGVNWSSMYRWDTDRRLYAGKLYVPLPLPGILHMEVGAARRSERWDLSHSVRPQFVDEAHRYDNKENAYFLSLHHIPDYRFEIGGGYEYVNRFAKGGFPQLGVDFANTGTAFMDTTFRFADGTYQNRLRLEGFTARKFLMSDFTFSGGTAEFNNRYTISKDTRTYFDWTVKAGTSRGQRPVEKYFELGLDLHPQNILRGHTLAVDGRYGDAPIGTDFVLGNFDLDRRIVTVPMFNSLNLPYVIIKWEIFVDVAKSWDRTHVFKNTVWLVDTGGGLKFETPATSLNVVLGRSLRTGTGVLTGYFERKLW